MTTHDKDKIIAAAKEVGAQQRVYKHSPGLDHFLLETEQLERFAAIMFEKGQKAEREECAKLCMQQCSVIEEPHEFERCAEAIRARSTK